MWSAIDMLNRRILATESDWNSVRAMKLVKQNPTISGRANQRTITMSMRPRSLLPLPTPQGSGTPLSMSLRQ